MDTNSTVKSRLKVFVEYLGMSERQFCATVGVGSAYIASIKKSIKADKLKAITMRYPQLNPIWLMRGEGDMLLEGVEAPVVIPGFTKEPEMSPSEMLYKLLEDAKEEKARLLSIIESQQRTIESLAEANKKAVALRGDDATSAAVG